MKSFIKYTLITAIILLSSCEKEPIVPAGPSQDQLNFLEQTKIVEIISKGENVFTLDIEQMQVNILSNIYNITDNSGIISKRILVSGTITKDAVVDVTYSSIDESGVATTISEYKDLKVVEEKNGFSFLWSEKLKTGIALPTLL